MKVIILGSGPNRIGQGIEFDYACVQAIFALREEGVQTVMVNCNPETVSTDYDTADRLYFEPIVLENVLEIIRREKPDGLLIQFGGQTPLKLSIPLRNLKVPILGTDPESIDIAEDREKFRDLINQLGLKQPESLTARTKEEALRRAKELGYPLLVRPSYVLGGRAMRIVYEEGELVEYLQEAVEVSYQRSILLDRYLSDSVEVDVDAIGDGKDFLIGAVMEHIEEAGVHSGDSAASIPPYTLGKDTVEEIKRQTKLIAKALKVKGLINLQFAVKDGEVYVLEVNPRASRTVPFVSKSVGYSLAKLAAKVCVGKRLRELVPEVFERLEKGNVHYCSDFLPKDWNYYTVKEVVFPWNRFPEVDPLLGPEMRSTGEVMGIDRKFGLAYYKAQLAAGSRLPTEGRVFISVADRDKPKVFGLAKGFLDLGFEVLATAGTHRFLKEMGLNVKQVLKVSEGRPNIVDMIKNGEVRAVINTPTGRRARSDAYHIRRATVQQGIPYTTTVRGGYAMLEAIRCYLEHNKSLEVYSLQEVFGEV